jgi:hypothetical protein
LRGFFFAARATGHPPASLLRARLKFATVQRDSFSKSVAVIPNVFCPNYYARRLKNESVCDTAIITSLAVPALAQGDPAKSEANKAEDQKKKEAEEIEKAYKDMLKRTTREQPVKKKTRGEIYASFLCAPMSARFVTSRGLCSTSQPSDAFATPWEGASLKAPHVAVPFLPHDLAPQLRPTWRAQTTLWCCVPSLVEQRRPRSSISS